MVVLLTPRLRLILVVGLLLVVGAVGFLMITRFRSNQSDNATPPQPVKPAQPAQPQATPGSKPSVTPHKPAVQQTRPAVTPSRPTAKPATAAPAVPKPTTIESGFPLPVARELAAGHVVVVSLYDPKTKIDGTALREAQAGALLAHAAFVPIDVSGAQVDPLNRRFGVIQDPAVLVLRAPGDLIVRIDGFADRDTVAQAASNAAQPGASATAGTEE
jgi:hypothetical protein